MNTFTLPTKPDRRRHLIFPLCLLLFTFLLPTSKIFAQNQNVPGLEVHAVPPVSASVSFEADPFTNPLDVTGRYELVEEPPNPNSVLPPPANDNCSTALLAANSLTPGGNYKCSGGAALMGNATIEAGENVSCFTPAPVGTVWHSFIANQSTMWIAVKPSGTVCGSAGGLIPSSFGLAVYASTTCMPTAPIACLNYYPANTSVANWSLFSKLNLTGLTAGQTYMIQIAWYAACTGNAWKPYCIKIGNPSTCTTCASIGTAGCGPMCVMAGSGWGTCCTAAQVNQITSTCPSYPLAPPMNVFDTQTQCHSFTATNDTVWLQQIIYSYCNPNTFTFTYNLYTNGCVPIQSGNVFANNQILNLVVGQTYKLCYTFQSACSWDSVLWPFAYTGSTTLPVEFVTWGALPFNEKVKLYWTTASEENAKEYVIERTLNAMDFTEICRVKAAGNSTSLLDYKAFDDSPGEGNNYYRIKQVDLNGNFTYTKMIAVRFSKSAKDLSIIPNPASEVALIRFNAAGQFTTTLKVTDMTGKIVSSREFISNEGSNEYSLNMREIGKGIYTIQLIVDDQNMISKLIKE